MIRGTPLLFQLFFVYFGLPILFDITLSSFLSAGITFINSWVAYITEIIRGGIESIDKGQFDAAKVLGFSYFQMMTRIIFPQAVARILPSITNQSIELIYSTSLLSTIGISDLLRNTKSLVIRDLNITPFIIAGIIYFALNSFQISIFKSIEYKFNKYKYENSKDQKDLKKI
jgi:polar amino acid transport system permease protein